MSVSDILDDYVRLEVFAAAVNKHERTIQRWTNQPDGLPYVKFGKERLVHVPTARAWLLSQVHQHNPRNPKRREVRRRG